MIDTLLERFRKKDRAALTRLLTMLAHGRDAAKILALLGPASNTSRVVAFIGSGGVGKSTLVGKLIDHVRGLGKTVGVLACDPKSPVSGGALLGDRFRMPARPEDDGVFIRSLASPSDQGAVPGNLADLIRLLEGFGLDLVFVETVGAGQGDTRIASLVDALVLLLQPETGDDLQWEKAGVLEVADVVVIHKADLPGADATEAHLRSSLDLPGARPVPIIQVSAKKNDGIASLWEAVAKLPLRRTADASTARDLLRLVNEGLAIRLTQMLNSREPTTRKLLDDWRQGTIGEHEAVERLLRLLSG